MKIPHFKKTAKISALAALALLSFIALSLLIIPVPGARDFAVSPTLLDRHGNLYHARLSSDSEWLLPRPLSEMGQWLPKVAVAIEDKRFYDHPGVDPLALGRAILQNASQRRVVSGASTITVQVVRLSNVKDRTIWNKYVEFIGALKLSRVMDKDEVMEIYLNRAPFGGNLRGAEAAARYYFDKNARDLSLGESALLVALLRGPSLYRPDRRPHLARQRRDVILDMLAAKGVVTKEQAEAAKQEPVTGQRGHMARRVWHLSENIFAQAGGPETWRWGYLGREYGLATSVDLPLQTVLEERLSHGLTAFPKRVTGAGAIMDNATGELLAYVGNARWTGDSKDSFVDCGLALRSPGSTLKPFIYLAAFQHKGLTPATILADTPLNLSGQAPRNFDRYYRGPVSTRSALADSLNAPAVRVLRLTGLDTALETLRKAGFVNLTKAGSYYGDSLALGGCEVSLWQQLKGYGMLARQGLAVEPTWRKGANRSSARLFPAGAVWLVTESLKDNSRLPVGLRLGSNNEPAGEMAFKTGTSHGLRDAWLAAYTPSYTLALWAGDPEGKSHPDLTAIKALGPVLSPLAADLSSFAATRWPPRPPAGVEEYYACPISGQPAGPHCQGRIKAFRLAEGARTHPCRLHVMEGGRIVTVWPPELAGFMATLGERPSFRTVEALTGSSKPAITSPAPGGSITVNGGEASIPLRCEGVMWPVHWFLNDEYFLSAGAEAAPILRLSAGSHRITLIDKNGRTAGSDFTIMYSQNRDRDAALPVLSFN